MVDRQLLRGNLKVKGGFWLNQPDQIFAKDRPGDQISPGVVVEEESKQE